MAVWCLIGYESKRADFAQGLAMEIFSRSRRDQLHPP